LYSHVFQRGSTEHGYDSTGDRFLSDHSPNEIRRNRFPLQVQFRQLVGKVGQSVQEMVPEEISLRDTFGFDGLVRVGSTIVFRIPVDLLELDQVYYTQKSRFLSDGYLDREGIGSEFLSNLLHHLEEIRSHSIHLVYVGKSRYPIGIRLVPDCFRLGFHTPHRTEHGDGSVQYSQ
jgi:hypothetical protein